MDEIQNSPEAIAYLRFFYEEAPELPVVCAGSLLEVYIDTYSVSFPVGRVPVSLSPRFWRVSG